MFSWHMVMRAADQMRQHADATDVLRELNQNV
jgi:hypothetical protein